MIIKIHPNNKSYFSVELSRWALCLLPNTFHVNFRNVKKKTGIKMGPRKEIKMGVLV